ncbi:MAG: HEAT repeat domain-containing protein [bacterium]
MHIRHLLFASAIALPTVFSMAAPQRAAQASYRAHQDAQLLTAIPDMPPVAWADDDPADSLYRAGRAAITNSDFRKAAALFAEIGRRYPKSAYAPDAPYWRAFALYRIGGEDELREALSEIDSQQQHFPKAKTVADGKTLAVRINGALAKMGNEGAAVEITKRAAKGVDCPREGDDDMRMAAMNALLQMDAQNALPIIKEVLRKRDACSSALREKAVFLLSQKQTPETEDLLIDVERNDPSASVREQAVFWLSQVHTEKAASALEEIATTSKDNALREKAIFALSEQGSPRAASLLRRIAESDESPSSVREQAIFWLGQRKSAENADFLRSLFGKLGKGERNEELRKKVLFSLSQMRGVGNDKWLLDIALDKSNSEEMRGHALWTAGQAGVSGTELVSLYNRLTDAPLKEKLIWVLSESRDRVASDKLVEIAQKDPDREMRKKAIFWLGQKNDPRIRQILMDIIKGD